MRLCYYIYCSDLKKNVIFELVSLSCARFIWEDVFARGDKLDIWQDYVIWMYDGWLIVWWLLVLLVWLPGLFIFLFGSKCALGMLFVVCCLLSIVYCLQFLVLVLGFQYYWLVTKPLNCCHIHLHFITPLTIQLWAM